MKKTRFLGQMAAAVALLGAIGIAQIRSMTLTEMVNETDQGVYGEIVSSKVFMVEHPTEKREQYFTQITVEGRLVGSQTPVTVDVIFSGGFLDEEHGVYDSEAPSADDTKVGNQIVAFYKWQDDLGDGVSGNILMAAHGGLFRTMNGPRGALVQGRGQGYAITSNIALTSLDGQVQELQAKKKQR